MSDYAALRLQVEVYRLEGMAIADIMERLGRGNEPIPQETVRWLGGRMLDVWSDVQMAIEVLPVG